jgi:hypothetical protein
MLLQLFFIRFLFFLFTFFFIYSSQTMLESLSLDYSHH